MQEWKDKCSAIYESHLNIQQKLQSDLTVLLETMVASTTHNRVESIFRVNFSSRYLSWLFILIFQVDFFGSIWIKIKFEHKDFPNIICHSNWLLILVLVYFDSSQHMYFISTNLYCKPYYRFQKDKAIRPLRTKG